MNPINIIERGAGAVRGVVVQRFFACLLLAAVAPRAAAAPDVVPLCLD